MVRKYRTDSEKIDAFDTQCMYRYLRSEIGCGDCIPKDEMGILNSSLDDWAETNVNTYTSYEMKCYGFWVIIRSAARLSLTRTLGPRFAESSPTWGSAPRTGQERTSKNSMHPHVDQYRKSRELLIVTRIVINTIIGKKEDYSTKHHK